MEAPRKKARGRRRGMPAAVLPRSPSPDRGRRLRALRSDGRPQLSAHQMRRQKPGKRQRGQSEWRGGRRRQIGCVQGKEFTRVRSVFLPIPLETEIGLCQNNVSLSSVRVRQRRGRLQRGKQGRAGSRFNSMIIDQGRSEGRQLEDMYSQSSVKINPSMFT